MVGSVWPEGERRLTSHACRGKRLSLTLEHEVLLALGVDPALIHRELKEMETMAYSSATNQRVIGSTNELSMHVGLEL